MTGAYFMAVVQAVRFHGVNVDVVKLSSISLAFVASDFSRHEALVCFCHISWAVFVLLIFIDVAANPVTVYM